MNSPNVASPILRAELTISDPLDFRWNEDITLDKMELPADLHRFSVQECLDLAPLPATSDNPSAQRYMSRQPAWKPGNDLPWGEINREKTKPRKFGPSAFGGHVYAQAPLAAAKVVEKEDESAPAKGKLAIHVSRYGISQRFKILEH